MISKAIWFEFSSYKARFEDKTCEFNYAIHFSDGKQIHFTEKIVFDDHQTSISTIPPALLENVLYSLHLMLGISYWKLYCPPQILIKTRPLTKEQAQFWNTVYTNGLGEFFYQNQIDFKGLIQFPYDKNVHTFHEKSISFERQSRSLLGVGGGKDSIVAMELLRNMNQSVSAYILETQKPHVLSEEVIEIMEIDTVKVKRIIDPQLFEKNNIVGAYNGHIPISAVFAFIGILTALMYDYSYVIVGNEKSASSENLIWNGTEINHQWSKSAEFEKLFQEYVEKNITPSVKYFSLLRPYSEMKIVEMFAKYEEYFSIFSSCNRNFKVHKESGLGNSLWCGECPKCAFMFALLAVYIPKEKMIKMFGKNMFLDQNLVELYRELLGLTGKKPFECVGTFEETKLAFAMIHEQGEYEDNSVMKMFKEEVFESLRIDELKSEVFENGDFSLMPEEFRKI